MGVVVREITIDVETKIFVPLVVRLLVRVAKLKMKQHLHRFVVSYSQIAYR